MTIMSNNNNVNISNNNGNVYQWSNDNRNDEICINEINNEENDQWRNIV